MPKGVPGFKSEQLRLLIVMDFPSITKFCKKFGVRKDTVDGWLYDGANPTQENLEKLCKFFGVPPDWFYCDMEPLFKNKHFRQIWKVLDEATPQAATAMNQAIDKIWGWQKQNQEDRGTNIIEDAEE